MKKNGSSKLTKIQETMSLTKVQGILTSQIRSRKSSNTPYMAFFRWNKENELHLFNQHSLKDCAEQKCKVCEIPVVFRIKSKKEFCSRGFHKDIDCIKCFKPNLSKGNLVELEGEFSPSEKSNRPSFTCYSYSIIKSYGSN